MHACMHAHTSITPWTTTMVTMVRERRHRQTLRLPLPPQPPDCYYTTIFSLPPKSPVATPVDSLSDLEKLSVIGHGSSAVVYKVRHRRTAALFALKILSGGAAASEAAREADILSRADSPYVVRCHGVIDGDEHLCFVMEYMAGGSLHDVLRARQRPLPEALIAGVARRVLEGLRYLHGIGVVHRDIKPSNLLVGARGEVKIADFGASGSAAVEEEGATGTCGYMSPERFDSHGFGGPGAGFAGDLWALGVVLLECHVGRFPLVGDGERADWAAVVCAVCLGDPLEVPDPASPEFRSFVGRCLEKDWRRRGTVAELLDHPFLNKCCCSMEGLVVEEGLIS